MFFHTIAYDDVLTYVCAKMNTMFSRRSLRITRFAISALFFVNGAGFASWVPHIPAVQKKFALSEGDLGLSLLSIAAGAMLSMPVTGWLISRFGSRTLLIFISVLYCFLLPLLVASAAFPMFIFALFIFGVCNGAMDVAMNAHGVSVEKLFGKPIMSSLHGLFSLGGLVGASLAGLLLSRGWTPFQHVATVSAILLVLVHIALPILLPKSQENIEAHDASEPIFVLPKGPLLTLGLMAFFILMVEGAMADWTAVYIADLPETSNALAAAGFAAFSLTMAAGRLTGDYIVRKAGKLVVVRYGILLSAVGLVVAASVASPWVAIAGFGLVGMGLANVIPIIFGAAGNVPGVASGKGIAAVTTAAYTGFLVGPPLIGFTAEVITLAGSFLLLAGTFLLVAVYARIIQQVPSAVR